MARIEDRTITLAGEQRIVIRTAGLADARSFRDFQLKVFADSAYMIHRPEEYRRTAREERRLIKAKLESPDQLYLLAESEGQFVGLVTSRVDPRQRVKHSIQIGLAVDSEWRGKRLGEALLRVFIDWAESRTALRRIELSVTDGNQPAQKLYKKLGFIEEGRRKGAIRLAEEDFRDDILMCRQLRQEMQPLSEDAAQ